MKRRKFSREIKKRILILCEDEKSSLLYFKSFKKDEEFKRHLSAVSVDVYHPENNSPWGLVKDAIKRRDFQEEEKNPYDEIWVVFDKDKHTNIPEAYKLAKKEKINIAISIICFEFWVLLHFEYTTKPFNKCDELIKYIKSKKYISNYQKCSNCFDIIRDKITTAIANAKKVEKSNKNALNRGTKVYRLSAYTDVHKIVEILSNIK